MYYGVLKTQQNTGAMDELSAVFATPLSIASNLSESVGDTLSLKRIGASTGHQRWEVTANISQTRDGVPFFLSLVKAGRSKHIYLRMPQPIGAESEGNISILMTHNVTAGSTNVNAPATQIPVGSFIQFEGLPKVYLVTEKTTNSFKIFPEARAFVLAGTKILYGGRVSLRAYVDDNIIGISYADGVLTEGGSYKFVEGL